MKFVADLHLHSRYSRAVSQQMMLSQMAYWAKLKGISVLASADFTHPFWFDKLKNELEDAGNGLYRLKTNDTSASLSASKGLTKKNQALDVSHSALSEQKVYFLLSCEVSSIYSQGGKGRRIHNLFFFPSLDSVEKFNSELLRRGANLRSDGRPIVGISSRDLAEIALNISKGALIIPAHVWTPWFSVFGAFSGFDSLKECFGDMTDYVYGIETGLSSDPAMNWRISELKDKSILSFSDAHSLEKMGREATVFEADQISYDAIYQAITYPSMLALRSPRQFGEPSNASAPAELGVRSPAATLGKASPHAEAPRAKPSNHLTIQPSNYPNIAFTIEFYPEEGKYHFTGHRDCNVSFSPQETAQKGDICPVCGRKLTIGVMHRVEELAQRNSKFEIRNQNGVRWVYPEGETRPPYVSLVPLGEILGESLGETRVGVGTKKVMDQYLTLVNALESEFNVLLKADLSDIEKYAPPRVVEAIEKVRNGNIMVDPGYDGKFGVVEIWKEKKEVLGEEVMNNNEEAQLNLFAGR